MSPCVYIIDDDDAIRDALGWLLQSRALESRSYASAEAFLAAWSPELRGCLLLDIRMGGMSGPELHDRLRESGSTLPVIFLTGHGDVPMAVAALKNGAFDFVEKPCNDNELVDRVLEALKRDTEQRDAATSNDTVNARLAHLSAREREVMQGVLAGKMNKVIADELNLAMRTVEVHRARLFEKMQVRTAVELVQLLAGRKLG